MIVVVGGALGVCEAFKSRFVTRCGWDMSMIVVRKRRWSLVWWLLIVITVLMIIKIGPTSKSF